MAIAIAAPSDALGQTPKSPAGDEAAVRKAGNDYKAALTKGDAKQIAEFWTADGTLTDASGKAVKAKDVIQPAGDAKKQTAPPAEESKSTIRFVTPEVAVEEGTVKPASSGAAAPVVSYSAMWVLQSGKWKIDSLREMRTAAGSAAAAAPANQLAELEIFNGQWSGEVNKLNLQISAKWNATKTFLRRDFTIASGGKTAFSGVQEIGWDPDARQIKSWMFYDDGSYGEGIWSLEGNAWMVLSWRELPDGTASTATQVYQFPDKNTLQWNIVHGAIDGHAAPETQVILKRTPAAK
ncbi:MAG TPA: nuclear transport factor 2 family protein [Pirellulales bacterium]